MANFPTGAATGSIFSTGQNVYRYAGHNQWEIISPDISFGYPEMTGSFTDLSGSLETLANVGASTISNITASVLHLDGTFSSGSNIAIPLTGSAVKLRTETGHREDVVLYLKFDGPDGSTSGVGFVDSSPSNHTVTAYLGAKIDASTSIIGTSSAFFDGSDDYLDIPYSDDFDFGSDSYTVHCWYKPLSSVADQYIMSINWASGGSNLAQVTLEGSNTGAAGKMRVGAGATDGGGGQFTAYSTAHLDLGTWHHIAAVKYGDVLTCYVDGVADASPQTMSGDLVNSNTGIKIGKRDVGTHSHCNLDEIVIIKGTALWTSDFDLETELGSTPESYKPSNYPKLKIENKYNNILTEYTVDMTSDDTRSALTGSN